MKNCDFRMLLPKALYILITMAGSGWGRFQTIYFDNRGLSPSIIGLLRGVGLVFKSMSYPMWGFLADWTGSLKLVLVCTILASTVALGLFQFDWAFSSLGILILVQIFRSSSNAVWPLVDSYTIAYVKRTDTKESYGHQRLWCAISWGLTSFILGILIDQTDLSYIFYFTYIMVFLELFLISCFMSGDITLSTNETQDKTMLWNSLSLFSEKRFFIFFVMIFFYGVAMSIPETFLFLFMKNELGSTNTEMGLSLAISVLLEIPIFYYSQQLIIKYSANKLLLYSQITSLGRMLAYMLVTKNTAWMVHLIQISHGVCFAGFWVPVVHIGQEMAPNGLGFTAHTLISSIYATFGHGCGGVFWGYVYEYYGYFMVFAGGALTLFSVALLTSLLPKLDTHRKHDIQELQ